MSEEGTGRRSLRLRKEAPQEASPDLNRKRKRGEPLQEEPPSKKMAEEEGQCKILSAISSLNKRFDDVPNRRDLSQMEINIRSRINENSKEITRMRAEQAADRANLPRVVKRIVTEEMSKNKGARTGQMPMSKDELDKEKSYLLARRSMRMWPASINKDAKTLLVAARIFCITILKMSADDAGALQITDAIAAPPTRRGKIKDEIIVTFKTAGERDLVQAFAPNLKELKGAAGVRLEIPEHLQTTFKLLEGHANGVRAKYQEGIRRSIKYDDSDRSLALDICLPNSTTWHRITPVQALEAKKAREEEEMASVRSLPRASRRPREALVLPSRERQETRRGIRQSTAPAGGSFAGRRPRPTTAPGPNTQPEEINLTDYESETPSEEGDDNEMMRDDFTSPTPNMS